MKPSEECKIYGLGGLKDLSDATKTSVQTLINWHKNKHDLFKIVVSGVVYEKTVKNQNELTEKQTLAK